MKLTRAHLVWLFLAGACSAPPSQPSQQQSVSARAMSPPSATAHKLTPRQGHSDAAHTIFHADIASRRHRSRW
jgi:hypothetical protein